MTTYSLAKDAFELPITGADPSAALGYDAYVTEYLSYGAALRQLFVVADKNPDAPLLNAHAAALNLAFEARSGWAAAQPYLARAEASLANAHERERLFCQSVIAWRNSDYRQACDLLDELTVRWPADLCAIKWGQYHAFNLGDAGAMLRFAERARIVHKDRPYTHGMIAFALEQNHRLDEAEAEGLHASEIAIDDAWAHHAVAHVMDAQGRAQDGVRWLTRCAHTWEKKGVFIRDHNWWHAALFQLMLGQPGEALKIYDAHLWGAWPEFPQEQIGAIAMLLRLEMRGVDVGERWEPVLTEVRAHAQDHLHPFHDLHYIAALARAGGGQETDQFIAEIKTGIANGALNKVWPEIVLPAAQSMISFHRGERERAIELLSPHMTNLYRIGGSHAQRHLFTEMLLAAEKPDALRCQL